jgi:hypothetical protein
MHLTPKLAAHSVKSVHLSRKFSPEKLERQTPRNALFIRFRDMGLSANMAHDFVNRVHPPKFNSGKFESLPKKPKPLLPSVFMRKGNSLRGIAGGHKRRIEQAPVLRGVKHG